MTRPSVFWNPKHRTVMTMIIRVIILIILIIMAATMSKTVMITQITVCLSNLLISA